MTHNAPPLALSATVLPLLVACSGGSTAPTGSADGQVAATEATEVDTTAGSAPTASTDAQPTRPPTPGLDSAVTQPAPTPAAPMETKLARIPVRFVGTWAPDTRACTANYDYQPAFQRIVITPDRVGFFETSGEVLNVAEAGGSTRITLRERVGDNTPVYPIIISLADNGRALNFIRDGERKVYVKCAG